jgi:hypothetical protein
MCIDYLKSNRIIIPSLIDLPKNPTVHISDIRKRRFSIIDRYDDLEVYLLCA